jgi:secondary thiamine-phosphate synthase enzyme
VRTHHCEYTTITAGAPDFVDITDDVAGALSLSGIHDGQVTVFSPEGACSLLLQERESGLLCDIEEAIQRLGGRAALDQGAVVGSRSVVVPAVGGRLRLGMWQRVLLVELGEPRTRSVVVHIVGE